MPLFRDAWTLGRFLAGLPAFLRKRMTRAEIVMADRVLGAQVWLAWETLRVELLYATLVVIASLGIGLTGGLRLIRRAVVPWQVDAGVTR